MRILLSVTILSFLLFSCGNGDCNGPDVSDISIDLEVKRLDQMLFALNNKEEIQSFLDSQPLYAERFIGVRNYPADSVVVNELYRLINDAHIDTLYQETQEVFGDMSGLISEFEEAFRYIKYYYPDFTPPAIYTAFSGLGSMGQDIFVSDEAIIISLEFFLGEDASYRPQVYDYILKRYKPSFIVPTCIMLYSSKYNTTDMEDNTLLADMVFYGKSYYFTRQAMPCLPDSIIAGYSEAQASLVENNTRVIWSHFIDNELLYETSDFVKPRYVDERPNIIEISNQVPGRIGRWLGWKIVEEYMKKTDTTLPALMQERDAQKIFRQSRYKP